MGEGGVLFEFLLDLTQDALLILGERHKAIIARFRSILNAVGAFLVTSSDRSISGRCVASTTTPAGAPPRRPARCMPVSGEVSRYVPT